MKKLILGLFFVLGGLSSAKADGLLGGTQDMTILPNSTVPAGSTFTVNGSLIVNGTHTVTGALTVNTTLNNSGLAGGTILSSFNANSTITVASNTVTVDGLYVCTINDTNAPWTGQTGHVPCVVGLIQDLTNSRIVGYGVEGRTNGQGSPYLYGGVLGLASHKSVSSSSSTVIGLIAREEMYNADGASLSVGTDTFVGVEIVQPVGTPQTNQGFSILGMSTYPYTIAGNLAIEPVPSYPGGLQIATWPAAQTANLFVNTQQNALPGVFFESGASGNYFWQELGRTGEDADIVVPGATNNFMQGTQAGDLGLRETNNTNKVVISAGAGQGTLYVQRSSVTVNANTFPAVGQASFNVYPSSAITYGVGVSTTVGGPWIVDISTSGHLNAQTNTAPTTAACGTNPVVAAGAGEIRGSVTLGTGGIQACSVVFAQPYNTAPVCTYSINSSTITLGNYGVSTTSFTVSTSLPASNFKVNYICMGSD